VISNEIDVSVSEELDREYININISFSRFALLDIGYDNIIDIAKDKAIHNSTVKLMDPIVVTIEKTAEQKDITERVRALANYNREKFIDSLK